MKMLDLFSGIGGFSLAAHWAGIDTVAFCEKEPYCQKVLKKNFPDIPIFSDIKNLKRSDINGTIDIITGGFPCQPFSIAGRKKGTEDDRDLWPEMLRVIQEFQPTWIIGENVANFVNMAFQRTKTDLESEGYEVQPLILPACSVGAPHKRDRVWILAYAQSIESYERTNAKHSETRGLQRSLGRKSSDAPNTKSIRQPGCEVEQYLRQWQSEPTLGRVANGVPNRVDRLKSLGNAIVPQVAYHILKAINDIEK